MPWHLAFQYSGGSPRARAVVYRLFGIGFLLMGLLHLVGGIGWFTVELRHPAGDHSPYTNLLFVASGGLSASLGYWLCTRVPFRPDLGDVSAILGRAGGYTPEYVAEHRRAKRAWWTGDVMSRDDLDPDA